MASVGFAAKRVLSVLAVAFMSFAPMASAAPLDEAQTAEYPAEKFKHAAEDYFHDMDNGISLYPEEVQGRNMWVLWTGGNDKFWDGVTKNSLGTFDLLKIVTSHPSQTYCYGHCERDSRWKWYGVVNEPCFDKPTGPDPVRFGLWLDVRRKDCPAEPFEDESKYPGVKIGSRGKPLGDGKTLPVGSYYGYPTGVVGLRLFPNPDFDEAAARAWDPERFYTDKDYYTNPKLVRPYRVGMSCGFCHVGPSPIHPPADPAHPTWADLNSTVGAQYLWMDRILVYAADESNFLYQLVHSYPPGTMDTSLVSTDYINNPRTMNAVYNLGVRLGISKKWGKEALSGGELNNAQLDGFFDKPSTSWTPRVLKDGSDAVGVLGALNRVYINIGLYSEEWTRHFNAMYGGKVISPILIATAQENSAYWRATVAGTGNMAKFLLRAGRPDKLEAAPGGKQYLNADAAQLDQGKKVFAETCARCHSSKLPDEAWTMLDPGGCSGPNYLTCWRKYWQYTQKDDFKAKMREIVAKSDFLENNYLSTDARVPATLLRTNACSPLATNAIRDNIWDNFSSSTYKDLPSVGAVAVQDPFTGDRRPFVMPGGGRGYTRVPSLISIWSTAPFFVNNRLGPFTTDPSVDARMKVFNASIEQLLWPERRDHEEGFDGVIVRTTQRSSIIIPKRAVPVEAESLVDGLSSEPFSRLFDKPGAYVLGPIPKGMPINILSNFQPLADLKTVDGQLEHAKNVADLGASFVLNLPPPEPDDSDAKILSWVGQSSSPLGKLNKCPDFVVNRGHYFGTGKFNETGGLTDDEKSWGVEPVLTQADKKALIEFIKTF